MKTMFVNISPELAKKYLEKNTNNRRLRTSVVNAYAQDMRQGNWQENAEAISFYEDGSLRDGQHRLAAIVASNTTQRMLVVTDVPMDSFICDRQGKRTVADFLKLTGHGEVANQLCSGGVRFMFLYAGKKVGESLVYTFITENEEDLETVYKIVARGSSTQISRKAPVFAAVYCAYKCGIDEKVLTRFIDVVNSGHESDPSEDAAIVLRNQLVFDCVKYGGAYSTQANIFRITLQAISDFSVCKPRTRKYPTKVECPYWTRVNKNIIYPFRYGFAR